MCSWTPLNLVTFSSAVREGETENDCMLSVIWSYFLKFSCWMQYFSDYQETCSQNTLFAGLIFYTLESKELLPPITKKTDSSETHFKKLTLIIFTAVGYAVEYYTFTAKHVSWPHPLQIKLIHPTKRLCTRSHTAQHRDNCRHHRLTEQSKTQCRHEIDELPSQLWGRRTFFKWCWAIYQNFLYPILVSFSPWNVPLLLKFHPEPTKAHAIHSKSINHSITHQSSD